MPNSGKPELGGTRWYRASGIGPFHEYTSAMARLRPHAINPTFVGLKSLTFSDGLALHCSNRSATLRPSDGVCWAEQGP